MRYILIFLALTACVFVGSVYGLAGTYAGGDGSAGSPAQIANATQLNSLMDNSDDWAYGYYFILTGDPDLSAAATENPIGDSTTQFEANFDGDGHTISNYTNASGGWNGEGLFGIIGLRGVVYDTTASTIALTGQQNLGGFVGINYGKVTNCHAINSVVVGDNESGGNNGCFVGHNLGTIHSCTVTGTSSMTGKYRLGGFCGLNGYREGYNVTSSEGTLYNCSTNASVTTDYSGECGGFCGQSNGSVVLCHSTGNVLWSGSATNKASVGGFLGHSAGGIVANCYSTGRVKVTSSGSISTIGGFIGELEYSGTRVSYCYSSGPVHYEGASGSKKIGGFAGLLFNSDVDYCYTISDVNVVSAAGDVDYLGGFAGTIGNVGSYITSVDNCYAQNSVLGGHQYIGGFAGNIYAGTTQTNCYCVGVAAGAHDFGGFSGTDADGATGNTYCFFNSTVYGSSTTASGTAKTTAEMKQAATYAGCTFSNTYWYITEGSTYPAFYYPKYGL